MVRMTFVPVAVAAVFGSAVLCPICEAGSPGTYNAPVAQPVAGDTATVKLAIRGMTCGSCATTARIALRRAAGVYSATVSYDSATAVVTYDPEKTSPPVFIRELAWLTGYQASVVADDAQPKQRRPGRPLTGGKQ